MLKEYLMQWLWIAGKVAITLTCIWTLQNLIHREGFFIPLQSLVVMSLIAIVGLRMWMPRAKS